MSDGFGGFDDDWGDFDLNSDDPEEENVGDKNAAVNVVNEVSQKAQTKSKKASNGDAGTDDTVLMEQV